jgi:hypothetical protein
MSSVAEDLKQFLIENEIGTDENIHVSNSPAVNLEQDDQFVIVQQGGTKTGGNILQWKRNQNFLLLYHNKSGADLYTIDKQLLAIEGCIILDNYKVVGSQISPMTELELGTNAVHIGSWTVQLGIVK